MQACDLAYNPSLGNHYRSPDLPVMSNGPSTSIHNEACSSPGQNSQDETDKPQNGTGDLRRSSRRPLRACAARATERLYTSQLTVDRKAKPAKKERIEEKSPPPSPQQQYTSKIVTQLVNFPPLPSQLSRWTLRSMWELASILNFLHIFRPLLNINAEFSVEEFETALLTPNDTLSDIHIPLLKAIPPVTRMALGRGTWVTVLCRKLRDWWHWVADGDIPIVASHGAEADAYKALEPAVRVVILKALCDIRVEQEDIRNYIENSLKHGAYLSAFRKERVGGDSQGISYWYEDDPIIGHRLYREIRKSEAKKVKARGSHVLPSTTYQWETVATNLEEFQDVAEKLFSSKNRTEASLGKKLQNNMLPEIEKVYKRKEKLLKKQSREALLLDNYMGVDGISLGRSLRDRKPVTYTFDDFDRSISEAIKITKQKHPSPEPNVRREVNVKPEATASINGTSSGPSEPPPNLRFSSLSPQSPDYDENDEANESEQLDRGNRRRQKPQRYSEKEFIEALSDNDADFDSDDDIVGEAVYDEEYLKKRKQKEDSSSSEGDEEYHIEGENGEDEDDDEEEEANSFTSSSEEDDSNGPPKKLRKMAGRTRRETKLRSVHELQSGLRRSKRSTKNRINYRKYDTSESENESMKPEKSSNKNPECSEESQDLEENNEKTNGEDHPIENNEKTKDEVVQKRHFLDLNELAPGSGFDDGSNGVKDEGTDDF